MNEKRKAIEPTLDPDSPPTRTRSDVAPKASADARAPGVPVRHISGLRPAVHLPDAPVVPPPPLTPEDLLEDGWDDEDDDDDDSGPTLLDPHKSVPRELVAQTRAVSDPIGGADREPETHEVRTREVATREVPATAFAGDEAPTGEMPTVSKPIDTASPELHDDDDEFSHDDFPTRQTPIGLQEALLAYPLPSDSHRGLHETMPPAVESTPDTAIAAAPAIAPAIAPSSPDETAQMPNAPALPRLDEILSTPPPPAERSSVSKVSVVSHVSQISHPSQVSHALRYPTPTSISGAPLLPANTVRFAFLRNLSPNNDPPLGRLALVATISFFATLVLSAFIAWIIVLVRH